MTTTLNATTSNGLVVTPDNSGNIVLQYNGVAAPAFKATGGTTTAPSGWSKIPISTEVYDSNNCYDTSTYRFTPNVAGYYQMNLCGSTTSGTNTTTTNGLSIYRNGSAGPTQYVYTVSGNYAPFGVSTIMYFNGTTDYAEAYVNGGQSSTWATGMEFSGCLLRGA
jgi:hypothetical protein